MKLLCETRVVERRTQTVKSTRASKATLALGYKHSEGGAKELELVHFTPTNKAGTKYKLAGNIETIRTRFINEGKATISLRVPAYDIFIQSDVLTLKSFLRTLRIGLQGGDIHLRETVHATPIPVKMQPIERLVINKRSKYPIKGFPKTLRILVVNNIGLERVPTTICVLTNLSSLDLSQNSINTLPNALGELQLRALNLSNNKIGENCNWNWLLGSIRKSLINLDLSMNVIKNFPYYLVKLERLVSLRLNDNLMERLPFSIRRLQNLRFLHLNSNRLKALPSCVEQMCLQSLDIAGNYFSDRQQITIEYPTEVPPLWVLAGRVILRNQIQYDEPGKLPTVVVDLIKELPICYCGKLIWNAKIYECSGLAYLRAISFLLSNASREYLTDNVICGRRCFGISILNRS
ncbi:leucine-rich repeat protein 1-like [Teleopsis dalmanni]|uniref:leucine-rich repeat protein 1-like n=1 Tax=Teleopsis dalmanni TaxID=139649 RepID=UPI0018CEE860|nr:leucine-rich repeat protein 1-like [Teleopsis dalmanni]XP_037927486.1 leucine-rich repeat protein 1-like [Teleopsis dalmanni]XP_037927487.1 leucine-rich repeat protein 1-like [Teleopsis dalmanni]XP_037927488.1 leucine-rich repeat protein 1-like [Teleopsis dalmanni]